ncbi:MAG: CehA/McbA family metallohydrolase, partial [Deltaproteobacteria bacterium]|nr:CehA/McbA family metallohydrolase [Deltaproteobacteria bacterium]
VYTIQPYPNKRPDGTYHYKGAIHLHTNYSHDGIGTIPELLLAASKAELNFVIVTDHNNMNAKEYEGYKQGVLLIAGMEVSTPYGHFLALDIGEDLKETERTDYFFKRIKSKGGFSVIAHPTSPSNPWTDKKNLEYDGIELITLKTYLENAFRPPFVRGIFSTIFTPVNFRWSMLNLMTYPKREIDFLSDALATHPVFITCGSDAHGKPPYDKVIDFCLTHIITDTPLTNEYTTDKKIILSAIRNGSLYIASDFIANADGFYAYMDINPKDNTRTLKVGIREFPEKNRLKINVFAMDKKVYSERGNSAVIKGLPTKHLRVEVMIDIPSVLFGSSEILWITALIL